MVAFQPAWAAAANRTAAKTNESMSKWSVGVISDQNGISPKPLTTDN
jgi:hypothetical protein